MSLQSPPNKDESKFIVNNNKKALELLMRMQSQLEASRVIATSYKPKGVNADE